MKLEQIKTGSFLYYTERPHSDYADALIQVVEVCGIQFPLHLATNWMGIYHARKDPICSDVSISSYFDEKCWHLANYDGSDPVAWMTKNYPLGGPTPITDTQRLDWLEAQADDSLYWVMDGDLTQQISVEQFPIPPNGYYQTARKAIDHAMEQERNQKLIQDQDYEPN